MDDEDNKDDGVRERFMLVLVVVVRRCWCRLSLLLSISMSSLSFSLSSSSSSLPPLSEIADENLNGLDVSTFREINVGVAIGDEGARDDNVPIPEAIAIAIAIVVV